MNRVCNRVGRHGHYSASRPPSKATIWRVVTGADPAVVDAVIGAWLLDQITNANPGGLSEGVSDPGGDTGSAGLVAIAVEGKTVRGATDGEGNQIHLLAAATHDKSLVLGQVEVGAKSNEIPMFAPLLDSLTDAGMINLNGVVITGDALCRRRHKASYEALRVMPRCCPETLLAAASLDGTSA